MSQPQDVTNESMYALFAPDGTWQAMSLAPDFPTCIAAINLLHKAKVGQSWHQLRLKGFKVLPVSVSLIVVGDENAVFQK